MKVNRHVARPARNLHRVTIWVAPLLAIGVFPPWGLAGLEQAQLSFSALAKQADAAREANRLADALALYQKALALRPAWAEGWWSLGTIHYDRNEYREAAKAFEKLTALAPHDGTAKVMLGLCEFELGEDDSALRHLQEGRQLGTIKDAQLRHVARFHEGVLLQRKGKFETAIETLQALCRDGLETDSLDQVLGMAALRIRAREPHQTTEAAVASRAGHAECLAGQRRFDSARSIYARLVEEHPNFPNLHYAYGGFLLEAQDTRAAVAEYQRELASNPRHVLARLKIAAVDYRVDSVAGLKYAEEAVKLDPQLPFAHYLLGLLLVDTRQYERAIPELEAAQRALPREPKVYFALGEAYAHAGRKEEAARARALFVRLSHESTATASGLSELAGQLAAKPQD
jgi:tetratricopeptide (TPR) repeat protein